MLQPPRRLRVLLSRNPNGGSLLYELAGEEVKYLCLKCGGVEVSHEPLLHLRLI